MADWFIATEGVKVVKDSASLWPQIITAVSSIGAALGGVSLTHHFTRRREERAAAAKQASERLFITTELVFLLERYAEHCAEVAVDNGEDDSRNFRVATVSSPDIDFDDISGDWRSLKDDLMYRIRELPVLHYEARRAISNAEDYDSPPDFSATFDERQYQYTRLGLKAIILARKLRKDAGLPATRLDISPWSAQPVLWNVWRAKRNVRAENALRMRRIFESPKGNEGLGDSTSSIQ